MEKVSVKEYLNENSVLFGSRAFGLDGNDWDFAVSSAVKILFQEEFERMRKINIYEDYMRDPDIYPEGTELYRTYMNDTYMDILVLPEQKHVMAIHEIIEDMKKHLKWNEIFNKETRVVEFEKRIKHKFNKEK